MALPSSGQISMDDIRVELGVPSQSPFSMNVARQGGYVPLNIFSPSLPPYSGTVSLASWYNYCQTCGYYTYNFGYNIGDPATACISTPTIYYATDSPLVIGSTLYYDISGSTVNPGYYSDGTTVYTYDVYLGEAYAVTAINSCSSVAYVEYEIISAGYIGDRASACAGWNFDFHYTVYAKALEGGNSASTVTRFYTDFANTPFSGNDGYYSWASISAPTNVWSGTVSSGGFTGDLAAC